PYNTLIETYGAQPLEAVIRGIYYPGHLERKYNLKFKMASAMEDQILPYGLGSVWAGAGAKFVNHGICGCVTNVPYSGTRKYEIYQWKGSDDSTLLTKWYSYSSNSYSLGGYAEARNPSTAVDRALAKCNTTAYPYKIAAAIGKGGDNLQTLTSEFVTVAQNRSNSNLKVIVSNEVDFFEDFIKTYPDIPSLSCSYGNDWDVLCESLAEVTAKVKRSTEKLRSAEALATLVSLKNNSFADNLSSLRDEAWTAFGLYWEHCWTSDGAITKAQRTDFQRRMQQKVSTYVDSLYNRSSKLLGGLINKTGTNTRFYVFNPLSWSRTDYADYAYNGSQTVHVVDLETGLEVPTQFITVDNLSYLRILASDVPSVGYKVFEIRDGAPQSSTNAATLSGNIIENPFFRIQLTNQGVITSMLDKQNGNRECVKVSNGKYVNDLGSGTGNSGTLTVVNNGPVSVSLLATSTAPLRHTSEITLFKTIPRVEITDKINQNFGAINSWAFSYNISSPDVWHEEIGAVIRAKLISQGGNYANDHAVYKWLTLNHFAAMSESQFGITLSNEDCSFMRLGQSSYSNLDTGTPQINAIAGGQLTENGLGILNQGGDSQFTYRFALGTYQTYSATASMRFALEHQNPLVAATVTGGNQYPETAFSLLTVADPNIFLWSVKPSEEGIKNGMILRFWNMSNNNLNSSLNVSGSITSAKLVTHIETERGTADYNNSQLPLNITHNQIKTYKITMALNEDTVVPGATAKPSGLVSVCQGQQTLTYNTSVASGASSYNWYSSPVGAGVISGNGTTAHFALDKNYYGKLKIWVKGQNKVGEGPPSDTLTTDIYQSPNVFAGNDLVVPYDTIIQLQGIVYGGSGSYFVKWEPDSLLQTSNILNPYTKNIKATTLFVLGVIDTKSSCTGIDTLSVSINVPVLKVTLQADNTTICKGDSVTVQALATGGTGNYNYSWSSSSSGFKSTAATIKVKLTTSTNLSLTLGDGNSSILDSIYITVNSLPNKPTIQQNGSVLFSSSLNNNQWVDTTGIVLGNGNQYQPVKDGYYRVVVTQNGCSSTSDSYLYKKVGTEENTVSERVSVFPNPTKDYFNIKTTITPSEIQLLNITGTLMVKGVYKDSKEAFEGRIDVSTLPKGIYMLRFIFFDSIVTKKICVE
ncbi:MAG: T9SS type A sorting domain-containing protein, partial [Bacteroidota bacterium]|nr:T9SS type A sorting domain-containing protein [Bacteroidota bacterium]